MSGGNSKPAPYYGKYRKKHRKKRIHHKKKKKVAQPVKLPPHKPTRPIKVIPLPPLRNLRGGRNSSGLLWYKCDNCNDLFPVSTSRRKKGATAFCDTKCQGQFHAQRLKGKPLSEETKKNISDTKRGIKKKKDVRTKEGDSWKDFAKAPKNPVWYKKAKDLAVAYRNTGEWRRKSKEIRKRDNHTCQGCGFDREEVNLMGVHHVKKLADWIYEGNNPSEYPDELLATLCHNCHSSTESQPDEYKWPVSSRGNATRPGFPI